MKRTRGQSTLEYAVLIAVVLAAVLSIEIYAKRAVEGRIKQGSDQIGDQWSTQSSNYSLTVTNTGSRQDVLTTQGASTSTIQQPEVQTRNAQSFNVTEPVATRDLFP